ncbi:MAG: ABC transporter substrate-binding protein [Halioglobus sp.]|nr:ABC transporter substrate-binding protein [Halioglobus sp.]
MRRLLGCLLAIAWSTQLLAQQVDSTGVVLALNWKPEPQFGGFYAAQMQGYYQDNNLDVSIIEGGSGTPTIQMLAAGKVDYAIVSADEVVIAHARGATNIVALFATFQISPQAIMTHAERDFTSIEEILHSDGVLLWQAGLPYSQYLKKEYAPIKAFTAPYLGGIGSFQNDSKISQQCFISSEPLTAVAAGLKIKTFLVADSGYNPYTTVLATTSERWTSSPSEIKAMIAAVRSGWNNYLEKPAHTNSAMQALNKAMSAETFGQSAQAQKELIRTKTTAHIGEMTLARWQTLGDQLLDLKIIQNPVSAKDLFIDLEPKYKAPQAQ